MIIQSLLVQLTLELSRIFMLTINSVEIGIRNLFGYDLIWLFFKRIFFSWLIHSNSLITPEAEDFQRDQPLEKLIMILKQKKKAIGYIYKCLFFTQNENIFSNCHKIAYLNFRWYNHIERNYTERRDFTTNDTNAIFKRE